MIGIRILATGALNLAIAESDGQVGSIPMFERAALGA